MKDEDLKKIQENIEKGAKSLTKTKEAVIVIGDTGEGKSALVNYLAGNTLKALADPLVDDEYIVEAIEPLGSLLIGNTTGS